MLPELSHRLSNLIPLLGKSFDPVLVIKLLFYLQNSPQRALLYYLSLLTVILSLVVYNAVLFTWNTRQFPSIKFEGWDCIFHFFRVPTLISGTQ